MKTLTYILRALGFIGSLIGDAFNSLIDALEKQKGFSAQFGSEGLIASRWNKGFVISKHRRLSRKTSFQNLGIIGPTGSGKSTMLVSKTLWELKNATLFINDPSMELYNLCSGKMAEHYTVKVLNFSNASGAGHNFLKRVKNDSDTDKLAHTLVSASLDRGGSSDPYWIISAQNTASIFIRLTLHQEERFRAMHTVVHLLKVFSAKPTQIDELIVRTQDKKLLLDYQSLIKIPERTLQSILSSTAAAVQIFDHAGVARATAYDSLNLENIRKKPHAVFLHTAISDQKHMSTVIGLFFQQAFDLLLEKMPDKTDLDCFLILEEASSLRIPLLPLALANLRKARVGTMLLLQQGHTQLKTLYGESDALNILGNTVTQLYLPGITDADTLKRLEMLSGRCVYEDEKGERVKPLVSADEARLLPTGKSLIVSSNFPMIKGRLSPFFRSLKYKTYAKIPPLPIVSDIPNEPLPVLI